jgi:4-hydroxy-tetrahydrodipicolinate synthase
MGADGVVPGLGNVDPAGYVRLNRLCQKHDWDRALAEQERLIRLFDIVNVGSPARMGRGASALGAFKAALHLQGIIDDPRTAPPYVQLNDEEVERVRTLLVAAGLL